MKCSAWAALPPLPTASTPATGEEALGQLAAPALEPACLGLQPRERTAQRGEVLARGRDAGEAPAAAGTCRPGGARGDELAVDVVGRGGHALPVEELAGPPHARAAEQGGALLGGQQPREDGRQPIGVARRARAAR